MKKLVAFSLTACLFLVSCIGHSAGPAKKFIKFEGARITGLEIGSAFNVVIEQGSVAKAEFEVSEDWVDQFEIKLDNGTLEVVKCNWGWWSRNPTLNLKLTCPTLEEVDVSGASSVEVRGNFSSSKLKVDVSGASDVKFIEPITVRGEVDVDVSGASVVRMIGSAGRVDLEASGASRVNLAGLTTSRVWCDVSGASSVDVFASQEAMGEASGASSVTVRGGGCINFTRVTGSSSVSPK